MSERRRDEADLEAFLAGKSPLSRRYREETGDEQPPARVDAAIMASARWAVGADNKPASGHRSASALAGAAWRSSRLARWSVPLATAAVVVIAVTLTVVIERDPEHARIEQKYDTARLEVRESEEPAARVRSEVGASTDAQVVQPERKAATEVPAERPSRREADRVKTDALKKERAQADTQTAAPLPESVTARQQEEDVAASEPDAVPALPFQADVAEEVITSNEPGSPAGRMEAEQSAASDAAAGAFPAAAQQDDQAVSVGIAGFSAPSQAPQPAAAEAPRQQIEQAPAPLLEPGATQPLAEASSPAVTVSGQARPDAAQWIEDIEQLLAEGQREEAIASLDRFRLEYPEYPLPQDLLLLLPSSTE